MRLIQIPLIAILAIGTCLGQALPPVPISQNAAVKQLLGLTDDQVSKMVQAQTENALFAEGKLRRIFQVNAEIDEETSKASLDAMALGVRYLELEVICRELRDAAAEIPKKNLGLLTDGQKVKMKILEEAVSLAPTIAQAQSLQLLPGRVFSGRIIPVIISQNRMGILSDTVSCGRTSLNTFGYSSLP